MLKTFVLAATAVISLATYVPAATIDFTSAGTGAAGKVEGGPLKYTSSAATTSLFPNTAQVSVTTRGLGISHFGDTQPGQIDGPLFTSETLTITFSWAVNLLNYKLRRIDSGDSYLISFNGGAFNSYGPGLNNTHTGIGQNNVKSFSVRAAGTSLIDSDNFTLAGATVAPVPLPAAGFLLIAAMGGLAALRRKRAA